MERIVMVPQFNGLEHTTTDREMEVRILQGLLNNAVVAQLVERHLAKVEVAGSSPVYRSKNKNMAKKKADMNVHDLSVKTAKFYEYNQNNSGGSFIVDKNLCHRLMIEADEQHLADRIAISLGVYFNGCYEGLDCD